MRQLGFQAMALLLLPLSAVGQFVNELEIPPVLSGNDFTLSIAHSEKQFIAGPKTRTIGFNGNYLGPTLVFKKGEEVDIEVHNDLGEPTTVHWHGMHVAPEDDGGPHTVIESGTIWNPDFEILDRASTFWYHPHLHEKTNEHVTLGASGLIIVQSEEEESLDLPRTYGVDDFPMIIQGKNMDVDNQFILDGGAQPFDNMILINGTANPFLNVPAQQVRFRALNASNETVILLGFEDDRTFFQIGSDGGLLSSPVAMTRLRLAPGERAEIIVDFNEDLSTTTRLVTYGSELDQGIPGGGGPSSQGIDGLDTSILEFRVIAGESSGPLPSSLSTHNPWKESEANRTRTITMNPFIFDGKVFDLDFINQSVQLNDIEIWELVNLSSVSHVFHIHDIQFYVLDRNGLAPAEHEKGLKDVVLVEGGETLRFITKFEDFSDPNVPYMYHCHILPHEDQGMMGQFLVVENVDEENEDEVLTAHEGPSKVIVYPNPVTDKIIRVLLPDGIMADSGIDFKIFDMSGAKVNHLASSVCGPSNLKVLYLEEYRSGIYNLYTVLDGKQIFSTRMILK